MVEIYDEDTLTEFELNRQRNIIKNFEFMKACGLPVKPLIYVKRVHVPLEEQFKYLSDESTDSSDEEWTLSPKKKKENKKEPKSVDIRIKVSNPTEFFKQKKKREEEERNGKKDEGESSQEHKTQNKKRKRKSKKKDEGDDAQPSTSGTSTSSKLSASGASISPNPSASGSSTSSKPSTSGTSTSSGSSKTSSTTKPSNTSSACQAIEDTSGASSVKVTAVKEKANGKQFIKERPKLPPSTLKRNRSNDSSSDEDDDNDMPEDHDAPLDDVSSYDIPVEVVPSRYPKREGQPRVNYSEAEVPDDDHYLFCAECNLYYQGECSEHVPIRPISDSTTSDGSLKARSSLPEGMEIKKSLIKDAGLGVFSTMAFKSGATFGPYAGEKIRADVPKIGLDTSYMWEIVKDLKVVYYINGKNEEFANWMRYVNCSRNEEEQNMIAYQFHGKIFYRVYKDVEAGTEFLVWYGGEYAGELGIALEEKVVNVRQGKFMTYKCDWCLICYAYDNALAKHKKYCKKKPRDTSISDDVEEGNSSVVESSGRHGSGNSKKGKNHECHICGKAFMRPAELTRHLRVHTGDKPFSCQQCGKKFTEKGHLTKHMMTHTQEQPFKCEVCGHQCSLADNLRAHMRVHTGERPYKCVVCGKGFKQSGDLKKHSRTHTGEKPYQCPHCEYKCCQKSDLNKHVKNQHRSEK